MIKNLITIFPQCFRCEHFDENTAEDEKRYTCPAFPDGIPDEILFNDFEHDKIHPEQRGDILFRLRKELLVA